MALQFQIMPVTPFRQNCTLLWDDETGDAVFTDVGGDSDFLWQEAQALGVSPKAIWLTHGHLDHAGGVVALTQAQTMPVLGPHPDDEYLLQALPKSTAEFQFPVSPAFTPERWLAEGEQLKVGGYTFEVLHIPGHTPGHVVFYCAEAKLLIAGDVLFYETIGRTDFPRSNHQDLIENIRSKLLVLPDDTRVIPGHGRMTTIGHERVYNPFL